MAVEVEVRGEEVDHGGDPGEEDAAGVTGGAAGGATQGQGDGGEEEEGAAAAVEAATFPSLQLYRRRHRSPISCPWSLSPRTTVRGALTLRGNSTYRLSRDVVILE